MVNLIADIGYIPLHVSDVNMSDSKYSQEEVERKRLLALQRKERIHQHKASEKLTAVAQPTTSPFSNSQSRALGASPASKKWKSIEPNNECQKNGENSARRKACPVRYNPTKKDTFYGSKTETVKGNCYVIDMTRFAVDMASFHSPLIETFKTIPSKSYDQRNKNWTFHLDDYEKLMEKLIALKPDVFVTGIPNVVLQAIRKYSNLPDSNKFVDLTRIDDHLRHCLTPFQADGVRFGILKNGRCIIADDMGLGKTIQALGIAHYYQSDWPLLIVAPSSVRYQWSEEMYNFLPSVSVHDIQHFSNSKDCIGFANIVIVSYDLLTRNSDAFEKCNFGVVILDESHLLKSIKTGRTKAVLRVTQHARRVILLSGTPALSRPAELFSQINLVMPKFMGFHDYGIRYCAGKQNQFGWDFSGSSNMQELQVFLKVSCLIRRLKNEVLKQLPSKIREFVILDPTLIKVGTKEMREMWQNLQNTCMNGVERRSALLQYYSESSKARTKAVCNYVADLLETGQKFLIFAHHQSLLDAICNKVEAEKIRYIRIDGKTSSDIRKHYIDTFQSSSDCRVAVLSITAANAGITLTAAQLVIFAELFWNPGILCQAEDRVHRIGQEDNVVIRYLVAKQTADDYLWPLLEEKLTVLNEAGLDQNVSFKGANVTEQKTAVDCQLKMETFLTKSASKSNDTSSTMVEMHAEDSSNNVKEEISQSSADYASLLEFDNDYFSNINLDIL